MKTNILLLKINTFTIHLSRIFKYLNLLCTVSADYEINTQFKFILGVFFDTDIQSISVFRCHFRKRTLRLSLENELYCWKNNFGLLETYSHYNCDPHKFTKQIIARHFWWSSETLFEIINFLLLYYAASIGMNIKLRYCRYCGYIVAWNFNLAIIFILGKKSTKEKMRVLSTLRKNR